MDAKMTKICFAVCAAACIGAAFLHEIAGTPMMILPLESTSLDKNVIGLLHFSWHAGTILALGMGALFACAAFIPGNRLMAVVSTAMTAGLSLIAVGMALLDPIMWETPAPVIWPVITLIGVIGLFASKRSSK